MESSESAGEPAQQPGEEPVSGPDCRKRAFRPNHFAAPVTSARPAVRRRRGVQQVFVPAGNSTYYAGTFTAEKRLAESLTFLTSYTGRRLSTTSAP